MLPSGPTQYLIFFLFPPFLSPSQLTPGSLYCHTRVASISCDLGHLVAACSSYETALDLNPAYLPALKGLGDTLVCQARACLQSNRDGQAVELIAKALPLLVRYVLVSHTRYMM